MRHATRPPLCLGTLDPQVGNHPAPSLVKLMASKPAEAIGDEIWVMADIAAKALHRTQLFVRYLLSNRMGEEAGHRLAEFLTGANLTHASPPVPD